MLKSLLIATTALVAIPAFAADVTDNAWFKAGQEAIAAKMAAQPNTGRAKNVIILIADGNGVGTNFATRIWMGQKEGKLGEEHVMAHEMFPNLALVKTYNTNAQTPDSAGTGTAMMTGVKTKAGVIGVDETLNRGDCAAVEAARVPNAAEIYSAMGKAVGVVSTARLTHATPASAYAHAADRNFEDDSKLPEGCTVPDIASQLVAAMKAGTVDVAFGGGRRHFIPKGVKGEEGKGGKRKDGKNLIEEAKAAGVTYVFDDSVKEVKAPALGLFESSHMKYEHDRTGEPSLAEMTGMAIKALQAERKALEAELADVKRKLATGGGGASAAEMIGDVALTAREVEGLGPKELKSAVDEMLAANPGVVALGVNADGKGSVVVGVSEPALSRGLDAPTLVRIAAPLVGAKGGGGRPNMAQTGGPDGAGVAAALEAVKDAVKAKLG